VGLVYIKMLVVFVYHVFDDVEILGQVLLFEKSLKLEHAPTNKITELFPLPQSKTRML